MEELMSLRKFGTQEPITQPDDNIPDELRKEAAATWTPEDSADLAQENEDLTSSGTDRS
jgi:hypothetical protein